ncbi:MAG: DMT family transporter [Pseudomonas sp.]|uniref:DMT family transporter n=1 Tax=Pseudomonas sp. TaxID=306 RepID=UPI0030F32388
MNHRSALTALHCGALMFGFTGVLGKLATTTPSMIVFGRALFAVLALAVFAKVIARIPWQHLSGKDWRRLALGGVLLAGHWVSFFIAVKVAGVAIATLGFTSFPALTVILEGLIFRERIRRNEIVLVCLVSIGLVLVTPDFNLASGATTGLLWGVLSGLLFALLSLVNRAGSGKVGPVQSALCQNLVVALCLLPFAVPELPSVSAINWFWIALLGVFCTGVAHSLFVASLDVLKARTAAVVFALEPVYGITFAWLIFSETPTTRMLVGGALIIFAIFLSARMGDGKAVEPVDAQPAATPDKP